PSKYPDLETLTAGLSFVLNGNGSTDRHPTVLAREPNIYASGCPSEIVTCRWNGGSDLRLFCKYGADTRSEAGDSQLKVKTWSDVPYEVEVYRHVLQPSQMSTATFYGTYKEEEVGRRWLVLQYLDGTLLSQML